MDFGIVKNKTNKITFLFFSFCCVKHKCHQGYEETCLNTSEVNCFYFEILQTNGLTTKYKYLYSLITCFLLHLSILGRLELSDFTVTMQFGLFISQESERLVVRCHLECAFLMSQSLGLSPCSTSHPSFLLVHSPPRKQQQ